MTILKTARNMAFAWLFFIMLLPNTSSSTATPRQDHKLSDRTTVPISVTTVIYPRQETTTKPSNEPETTPTTPASFLANVQTAETPGASTSFLLNIPTEGTNTTPESRVSTSRTTAVTSAANNPNTNTSVPSLLQTSTNNQGTPKNTLTSTISSDESIYQFTLPVQSTDFIAPSATATLAQSTEIKSISQTSVTAGQTVQSTVLYKSTKALPKPPPKRNLDVNKRKPEKNDQSKSKNGTNHGKVVAALIGGALVLMMVGFLVIFLKKRKLQRQQITTNEWAGPSPFLEGTTDDSQVTLRSTNRISFSSFLPQRLSKRLSLLPEAEEELMDMTPGSTFGGSHVNSIFTSVEDENKVSEINGTVPETKNSGDAPESTETVTSVASDNKQPAGGSSEPNSQAPSESTSNGF